MSYNLSGDWLGQNYYANANACTGFCIHHAAGTNQANVKNAFLSAETSAHYSIQGNNVIQYVEDCHGCWHCGNYWGNTHLIGIENVNSGGSAEGWPVAEETIDTLCEFLADKSKELGITRLVVGDNLFGHKDLYATFCPGVLYPRLQEIADRVNYILAGPQEPAAPKVPTQEEIEADRVARLPQSLKKYSDLWPDDWYVEPVQYVVENKIMLGVADTVFAPNDALLRAQAIAVLAHMDHADLSILPFDDIAPWYAEAIIWGAEKGYISDDNENARPEDNCTRAEFMTFLYRYAGAPAVANKIAGLADWQTDSVSWAVEQGIISDANNIRPNDACTRAEAATMVKNYLS